MKNETQIFLIKGIPKAQGRPRFARMGKYVKTYDPKESRVYKENVAAQIVARNPQYIADDAINVALRFFLPRPKSLKKSIVRHVKKPDVDNLAKACLDAMKGVVWRDDSQIDVLLISKCYTYHDPGVVIFVNNYSISQPDNMVSFDIMPEYNHIPEKGKNDEQQ